MFSANDNLILKGVGNGFIVNKKTGEVAFFDKSQKININHQTDSEDVFGGDSLSPIYTYAKQSTTEITMTNATFKASQLQILLSSKTIKDGVKATKSAKFTKQSAKLGGDNLTGVEPILATCDGVPVKVKSGDSADTDGIAISTTGEVTFGASAKEGEYLVLYKVDSEGMKTIVLGDSLPDFCEVYLNFTSESINGTKYLINVHFPHARCDGNVTLETARDSASTPEIKFKAIKEDGQEGVFEMTVTPISGDTGIATFSNRVGSAKVGKAQVGV